MAGILTGIGDSLMFVSAVMFFIVLGMTVFFGKPAKIEDIPFTETDRASAQRWTAGQSRPVQILGGGGDCVVRGDIQAGDLSTDTAAALLGWQY